VSDSTHIHTQLFDDQIGLY